MTDRRAFILDNTRLQAPPHTPELKLHLADEITPIWRLTEEALGALGVPPPFWAFAWAGGQALARYVLDTPAEVAAKRVLDFATGSGLVAIAAMRAGAQSVLACDVDDFCAAAVALNTAVNGVSVSFTAADLLDEPAPEVEVILAGDIFYESPVAERVERWLREAHGRGIRVLIGDPGRSYFPKAGLVQLATYEVETTRELEDQEVKRSGVWEMAG
ncbi:MAG: class I SAM-dependent methyltransferase [Caulobacteraceae bacterium]